MNRTVKPCEMSFPGQYRPGIFLGYQVKPGVANGTSKNVGLGKFCQDLEISEAFMISLEV